MAIRRTKRGFVLTDEHAHDYVRMVANDTGQPTVPVETTAPRPRIRLKDDIYDDGADHHPPGIIAHKGDVLEVRELFSVGAAHPGASPGKAFIVRVGEFEEIRPEEPECVHNLVESVSTLRVIDPYKAKCRVCYEFFDLPLQPEKASAPPCGNPVMVNTEWYRGCRLPSGHDGDCSPETTGGEG
jgi:hypothetical protein